MTPLDGLTAVLVLGAASTVAAIAGFGFALLAMPLLSVAIGPTSALAVVSLVSVVNSGATALSARTEAERGVLRRQVPAAFAGMPLGIAVLESMSGRVLQIAIAGTVALVATVIAFRLRLPPLGERADVVAGLTSGTLATSAGMSGPPLVFNLQSKRLPAATVRATMASHFVATGWVSTALLALRGHIDRGDAFVALAALPVMLATWRLGAMSFTRISQRRYETMIASLLFASAVTAFVRAL